MTTKNDKNYKMWFLKFMSYKDFSDENKYDEDSQFSQGELLQIKPEDICRYMNFKCFHNPEPSDGDTPKHARSSTLLYVKKSISHFMPHKAVQWDPVAETGNPTRSEKVQALIRRIKLFEARRQGKASLACRPLELDEFLNALDIIRSSNPKQQADRMKKYLMSAVLTLQWQLIARIDDMMKLKFEHIKVGPTNFSLMRCSNSEGREQNPQVILGSMDSRICPLLNMAVYIELVGREHEIAIDDFVFDNGNNNGSGVVGAKLTNVFQSDRFKSTKAGHLGTQSIRKGASTYASRCGQSKDAVERRGRWNKKGRDVDASLSFLDVSTASTLCGPRGACKYRLRRANIVTDNVLVSKVAREISRSMGNSIGSVLALPLLWAVFEDTRSAVPTYLPTALCKDIRTALSDTGLSFGEINPVERVLVNPTGKDGDLDFVESVPSTPARMVQSVQNEVASGLNRLDVNMALISQLNMLQQRVEQINSTFLSQMANIYARVDRQAQDINNSLTSIPLQPALRPVVLPNSINTSQSIAPRNVPVKLAPCPKTLRELWQEYEDGLGNTKPAKLFSAIERKANRYAYSRRKVFWDLVKRLVSQNFTSDTAIDYIYNIYGRGASVNKILLKLRADRISGDSELGKW